MAYGDPWLGMAQMHITRGDHQPTVNLGNDASNWNQAPERRSCVLLRTYVGTLRVYAGGKTRVMIVLTMADCTPLMTPEVVLGASDCLVLMSPTGADTNFTSSVLADRRGHRGLSGFGCQTLVTGHVHGPRASLTQVAWEEMLGAAVLARCVGVEAWIGGSQTDSDPHGFLELTLYNTT